MNHYITPTAQTEIKYVQYDNSVKNEFFSEII